MLFNYEHLDEFDSSEDCLVAKLLLGLVFNPFVPANGRDNYKLTREFLTYYIGEKARDLNFLSAQVLLKPKFTWFNTDKKQAKDRTAPDLLLLFPEDTIIALEVKYTLPIQAPQPSSLPHQLLREHEKLESLQKKFNTKEKYLFLLMTHQRLFSHIQRGSSNIGLQILRKCIKICGDEFRVNTWNCVYQALCKMNTESLPDKKEILTFFEQKKNYMTNSLDGRKSNAVELITREEDTYSLYKWDNLRDLIMS
jgi:hypothetical protein